MASYLLPTALKNIHCLKEFLTQEVLVTLGHAFVIFSMDMAHLIKVLIVVLKLRMVELVLWLILQNIIMPILQKPALATC